MISSLKNSINTVQELTRKQVKTQYRDSSLGFIWTILNPLLNMLVMWLVFKSVLHVTDPYYPIYLLTGNILFSALRNSTTQSLQSFVLNRNLLLRTKISLEVFPLSNVLTSIVNFAFSLIALIPFMIWLSISQGLNLFSYQLVFIIIMLPAFLLFEYGVGLFLACLFVFFRDIKHIYTVFLTLWNYITPIFWQVKMLDKNEIIYKLVNINPMYHFLNYFRDATYRGATCVDMWGANIGPYLPSWKTMLIIYGIGIITVGIGYLLFVCTRKKIITRI